MGTAEGLTDSQLEEALEVLMLSKLGGELKAAGISTEGPPLVRSIIAAVTVEHPTEGVRGFWAVFGENRFELIGLARSVLWDLQESINGEGKE